MFLNSYLAIYQYIQIRIQTYVSYICLGRHPPVIRDAWDVSTEQKHTDIYTCIYTYIYIYVCM